MTNSPYQQFFHDVVAPMAVLDRELKFVDVSELYISVLGRSRDELLGQHIFDVFPDTTENEAILRDAWAEALNGKSSVLSHVHYPIPATDDEAGEAMEDRWWAVHSGPVRLDDAPHELLIFRVEDITERIRLENAREVVTTELQHRMLNLTTLIGVIARQSAHSHDDLETFVPAFLDRLTSLARSSQLLVNATWEGLDMHDLVADTMAVFNDGDKAKVNWNGPKVALSASAAQAIAMGLHELATNAAKYGALKNEDATVTIRWCIACDETLSFLWKEDAQSIGTAKSKSEAGAREGFGSKMLKQLLPLQINGRAEHGMVDGGMQYLLVAPLNQFGERREVS